MILKRIHQKKLLKASSNQGEIFDTIFTIQEFSFKIREMSYYQKALGKQLSEIIENQIDNLQKTDFEDFNSKEGLQLYANKLNDQIIIISAGEKQPCLYMAYLEGIWEIQS